MANINSDELSHEFNQLIAEMNMEWTNQLTRDMFGEILHFGPVEPELQENTYNQEQYNNVPKAMCPEGHDLRYAGILNGQPVYEIIAPPVSAPTTSNSEERKREDNDQGEYIKKPPNAFMLFIKDQKATVEAELQTRGRAVITALGTRWKSLTKEEQAKYIEQAQNLKELHVQQHPGWSNKNSYGKKKNKKIRRNANVPKAEGG